MNRPQPQLSSADVTWLTILARNLTGNWSDADDLVQETWIAARTSPPGDGQVNRGWLMRVLYRFHFRSLRTTRRRSRRESEASRSEALPPTADLVERAELQKKLAESMIGLEEPYRTTLMLVVFESQSAASIAEHQGISVVHARRRIRKARELLREKLQRDYGEDWDYWSAALLPLAQTPLPWEVSAGQPAPGAEGAALSVSDATLAGGLGPWVAGAAVVATAGTIALKLVVSDPGASSGDGVREVASNAVAGEVAGTPAPDRTSDSRTAATAGRRAAGDSHPGATAAKEGADAAPGSFAVRGRVLVQGEFGAALAPTVGELMFETPDGKRSVPVAGGAFEFAIPSGEAWVLVRNARFEQRGAIFEAERRLGPLREEVELRLEASWLPTTDLEVVDALTGTALSGLTVVADRAPRARRGAIFPHPGDFEAAAVVAERAVSPVSLVPATAYQDVYFIRSAGYPWTAVRADHLVGGVRRVELVPGAADLTLRVSGAGEGPLRVLLRSPVDRGGSVAFEVDSDARAPIRHLPVGSVDVEVSDPDGRFGRATVELLEGPNDVELRLERPTPSDDVATGSLAGVLRVAEGWKPSQLRLELTGPRNHTATSADWSTESDGAWRFEFDALPAGRYRLEVVPTGHVVSVEIDARRPREVAIDVPVPVRVALDVRLAGSGQRVDDRVPGVEVRWRNADDGQLRAAQVARFERDTGLWEFESSAVPLEVAVSATGFVPVTAEAWPDRGAAPPVVRLRESCGLILELRSDGQRIPFDIGWMKAMQLTPIDGGFGELYTHAFDGVEMVHRASEPGRYELRLAPLEGFGAIAPLPVELVPGEVRRITLELEAES